MLETARVEPDAALLEDWRSRVRIARTALGWPVDAAAVVRKHATGTTLAIAAPIDQLFTATEVNEWALCAALHARDPQHWSGLREALAAAALETPDSPAAPHRPEIAPRAALERLARIAAAERRPALMALLAAATERDVPCLLDDTELTVGTGRGGRSFPFDALPAPADVDWPGRHGVPTALVTGSNGKTTTVRLLAACQRAHGWCAGYSCTDGVYVGGEETAVGDYSGPGGARRVLRDPRVEAAVLETARGGMLRRGLAVQFADVAVVTNVSADHFGEYGIHDLESLADVKLTVGTVLKQDALLVLNADDAVLRRRAPTLERRYGRAPTLGWFAADADDPWLAAHRDRGGSTCGVRAGRLLLDHAGGRHDLGAVTAMPLTAGAQAAYNVANAAAAALAAVALGVSPGTVSLVLARFGSLPDDNPGRLMRFERRGVHVLVDYAHNPEGLRGVLQVAESLRDGGARLGLVLGHAGNREDRDLERLAEAAAEFAPDLVVVKELEGYLRGRQPGEVPRILSAVLRRAGLPDSVLRQAPDELTAVHGALGWARPGDVLVLPVHGLAARREVLAMLRDRG